MSQMSKMTIPKKFEQPKLMLCEWHDDKQMSDCQAYSGYGICIKPEGEYNGHVCEGGILHLENDRYVCKAKLLPGKWCDITPVVKSCELIVDEAIEELKKWKKLGKPYGGLLKDSKLDDARK